MEQLNFGDTATPVWSWAKEIEETAMEQIHNLTKLPFTFHHVAIMPDCHAGYGMPIGGVLAADRAVVPNCTGVDIGCGVCAAKFDLKEITIEQVKLIMGKMRERIPVGFNHHSEKQEWPGFEQNVPDVRVVHEQLESAKYQLGTLGGGNHFCELQKDSNGFIWAMIHSGSRNFGLKIAKEYNSKAQWLCKLWYSNIPEYTGEDGLAFLPIESDEAKEYMLAMNYALTFAKESRARMMDQIHASIGEVLGTTTLLSIADVHHNYARWEHHYGKDVIVHRKGATSAKLGEIGIIPGSQGTASYIVEGLGNHASFNSCSHGAGRAMSRTKAQATLNLEDEIKKLDDKGIVHGIRNKQDLDEASSAYKNIEDVMAQQTDLVKIVEKLSPIGVIKG